MSKTNLQLLAPVKYDFHSLLNNYSSLKIKLDLPKPYPLLDAVSYNKQASKYPQLKS